MSTSAPPSATPVPDIPGPPSITPFLDLPAQHNTWVYDLVHFNFTGTSEYSLTDITTGAGTLLVSKIIDGLHHWGGYEAEDIAKVAGLVERNLYTVHSGQVKGEVERVTRPKSAEGEETSRDNKAWDIPRLTIDLMLRGLFDTAVTRDAVVQIVSNEPVLLINFDSESKTGRMSLKERDMLRYITDITTTDVRDRWNIWPVRVYAGAFLPCNPEGESGHPSFSITLLNVVNTDIGGPSMPQLLDEHCDAPEWTRVLREEVWRGTELVSREDNGDAVEQQGAQDEDNASERSMRSDGDDESVGSDALGDLAIVDDSKQEVAHESESTPAPGDTPSEQAGSDPEQGIPLPTQRVDLGFDDDSQMQEQDADETELQEHSLPQEPELPSRKISHPTWDRFDDRTSLLDLIRSQASIIAPFGTESAGHGVADVEGGAVGSGKAKVEPGRDVDDIEPAEAPARAKSSDEDEFVVV